MSGARTRIRPGDLIADRYRIESALGAGGMGIVFAATDLKSGAPVAIKILSAHLSDTATGHARFLREARASATIASAHAIRVLDTDTHDGTPFMVMERLEGFDLARVVASRGALPVPMAALALRQACDGVSAAHEASLVHRDIKPSNLFVARDEHGAERVVVLDFGISKATHAIGDTTELTATTEVFGSPRYMSPEQIRSAKNVDARTDVWSLGVVAYELLTGERPFAADALPALSAMILEEDPAPLSARRAEIPKELEAIVLRCLAKKPEARFATAHELGAALAPFSTTAPLALLDGVTIDGSVAHAGAPKSTRTLPPPMPLVAPQDPADAIATRHEPREATPPRAAKRRSTYFVVGLGAALAAGGLGAASIVLGQKTPPPAPPPSASASAVGCVVRGAQSYPSPWQAFRSSIAATDSGAVVSQWMREDGLIKSWMFETRTPGSEIAHRFRYELAGVPSQGDTRSVISDFGDEPVVVTSTWQSAIKPPRTFLALTNLAPPGGPFRPRSGRAVAQETTDLAVLAFRDALFAVTMGRPQPPSGMRSEVRLSQLYGQGTYDARALLHDAKTASEFLRGVAAAASPTRAGVAVRSFTQIHAFTFSAGRAISEVATFTEDNDAIRVAARGDEFFLFSGNGDGQWKSRRLAPGAPAFDEANALPSEVQTLAVVGNNDEIFAAWREPSTKRIRYGRARGPIDELLTRGGALDVDGAVHATAARGSRVWVAYETLSIGVTELSCP